MTNPQPPQWLIDELSKMSARWYDERFTPLEAIEIAAAAITAKFEQACGEDEDTRPVVTDIVHNGEPLILEDGDSVIRNHLRAEQRTAWYTDDSREGDKND